MRSTIIFAIAAALFVMAAMTEASWNSHHLHHEGATSKYPTCHFASEKGTFDLRLLMRDLGDKDWNLTPDGSEGSLLFNPCAAISNEACGKDSALCEITNKGEGISYGNYSAVHFAEVDEGRGFEMTFANGELCNNGSPRKTSVQFICSEPTNDPSTQVSLVTAMQRDECEIQLTVKSPYGCAAEQMCSVFDRATCEASQNLCNYNHQAHKCEMNAQDCRRFFGHLHLSHGALTGLCIAGGSLLLCGLTLCVCACRQRRRRCLTKANRVCRRRRQHNKTASKVVAPTEQTQVKDVEAPAQQEPVYVPMQYVYHPQQQMAYAVLNPYAMMQGGDNANMIPMVQFPASSNPQ